eukprot:5915341-Pyramimonas_sp.AAC.1
MGTGTDVERGTTVLRVSPALQFITVRTTVHDLHTTCVQLCVCDLRTNVCDCLCAQCALPKATIPSRRVRVPNPAACDFPTPAVSPLPRLRVDCLPLAVTFPPRHVNSPPPE